MEYMIYYSSSNFKILFLIQSIIMHFSQRWKIKSIKKYDQYICIDLNTIFNQF